MKIIYVNSPQQNESTPNPQIIDGKIPEWIVKSHMLKLGQTLREFLEERWDYVIREYGEGIIEGFYLYDVMPIYTEHTEKSSMMVRLAYIKI